jgi:hypothetical protein
VIEEWIGVKGWDGKRKKEIEVMRGAFVISRLTSV